MTVRRKWATIPAFIAIAAIATALSAYRGAQSAIRPAVAAALLAQAPTAQAPAAQAPAAQAPAAQAPGTPGAPAAGSTSTQTLANPMIDSAPTRGPWGYHGASSEQGYSPVQPIRFPHPQHVQKLGMNCVYCHFSANKSPDVGMPAVSTCMGCHSLIGPKLPARDGQPARDSKELAKLVGYWSRKQPIPWVRIHKVPEYVHFPHMRHVSAGVTCQTCHGQVQKMNQVFQYASLNMGWCINCHVNGYDPAQGDKASGYRKTANGFELIRTASTGGGISLVNEAHAQTTQPSAAIPDVPGGAALRGPIKHARYDCAICHY